MTGDRPTAVIESLWAALAAAIGSLDSISGVFAWQPFGWAALFLAGVAGLLLPSVRAYSGLT